MTKTFLLFIAIALLAGGGIGGVFAGGVALGKTQSEEPFLQEAIPVRQELQNWSHRGGLTGVIETVDGNIVTVNTAQGSVTATLVVDTTIQRVSEGTLADLNPGMRVSLVGEPGVDGAVTARSVLLNPEAAYGFFNTSLSTGDRQQWGQSVGDPNSTGREGQEHAPNPGSFFFGGGQQHSPSSSGSGGAPVHP